MWHYLELISKRPLMIPPNFVFANTEKHLNNP
jgi:hypothetical protein